MEVKGVDVEGTKVGLDVTGVDDEGEFVALGRAVGLNEG